MSANLLAAYDEHLRAGAEVRGAQRSERLGPLVLGVFGGDSGFITYRDLGGADRLDRQRLIAQALDRMRADPAVRTVEWKTRAHDDLPFLADDLRAAGFAPGEPESIMIGEAALLAQDLPLPAGVRLRSLTDPGDVRAAGAMADRVFGDEPSEDRVVDLLGRIAAGGELWAAEEDGQVIASGRLEPVSGTSFAGIWGGAVREDRRHRGIYRALSAARARSALQRGIRWLHSDSTGCSRPILERSGFAKVSETVPWEWRRDGP